MYTISLEWEKEGKTVIHTAMDNKWIGMVSVSDILKDGVVDVIQKLKPAGYPQLNQVQHTAFNRVELLNLNVESITANDLIWVANKTNNDWDVLRVTNAGIKISEIKSTTVADLHAHFEPMIDFTQNGNRGIIGKKEKILSQKDFFDNIPYLLKFKTKTLFLTN